MFGIVVDLEVTQFLYLLGVVRTVTAELLNQRNEISAVTV